VIGAQDAPEITKAAALVGVGGVLLKFLQWLLRVFDARRRVQHDDLDILLKAQAEMREELRKDNEALRARVESLEARATALEDELRKARARVTELEREREELIATKAEIEADLRLLKRTLAKEHGTL